MQRGDENPTFALKVSNPSIITTFEDLTNEKEIYMFDDSTVCPFRGLALKL